MVVDFRNLMERNRIGITVRRLQGFSVSRLQDSLDAIKAELDTPLVGVKRRAIEELEYSRKRNEYRLMSVIDVPVKVKELIVEEGELRIHERTEHIARRIGTAIRLNSTSMVFLSQTLREVQRFCKYIKEITLGGFNPVPSSLDQARIREFMEDFDSVNHLKLARMDGGGIGTIAFRGENLLAEELVSETLSSPNHSIHEIGGVLHLSPEKEMKCYLTDRGRMTLWADPREIVDKDVDRLIEAIEDLLVKK